MARLISIVALVLGITGLAWLVYGTPGSDTETLVDPAPEGAAMVTVTLPDMLSEQEERGAAAFAQFCASCHGAHGAGQDGVAPPLIHKIYEPSHHGDMAFVMAARNGVRAHHWKFGNMPPVEGISDDEIAQIIAYIRRLQRENGIE